MSRTGIASLDEIAKRDGLRVTTFSDVGEADVDVDAKGGDIMIVCERSKR